jgi:hypothetical protein
VVATIIAAVSLGHTIRSCLSVPSTNYFTNYEICIDNGIMSLEWVQRYPWRGYLRSPHGYENREVWIDPDRQRRSFLGFSFYTGTHMLDGGPAEDADEAGWTTKSTPYAVVGIPLLPVGIAIGAPGAFLLWRKRGHRTLNGCPTCGYNLTANISGVCPECGTVIFTEH